jgi:hypothetical protein
VGPRAGLDDVGKIGTVSTDYYVTSYVDIKIDYRLQIDVKVNVK